MLQEQEARIITSIHIPKTAGTTLKRFWMDLYGAENTMFYYPGKGGLYHATAEGVFRQPSPFMYRIKNVLMETDIGRRLYKLLHSSSKPKITTVNEAAIPDECRVIHGHFRPDHFRETITDARIVTVIRDPLERSISHYRYLKDHSKVMPIDPEYFTTGMSFQDFAQLPYQQNFQANYLQGESLSIFDTVGVVDELACYCARFDPNGNVEVSRLNTTEGEVFIPENFKEKFFQLNLRDYELYSEAARKNLLP